MIGAFSHEKGEDAKLREMDNQYFHGMSLSDIHAEVSEAIFRGARKAFVESEERALQLIPQRANEAKNIVGDGTITFDGPRQGWHWEVERICTDGTAGAAAIYIGMIAPAELVDNFTSIVKGIHPFDPIIFVPGNQPLLVSITGTAGAAVGVSVQYKRVPANASYPPRG